MIEHLKELRARLLRWALVFFILFVLAFWQAERVFAWLAHPMVEALGAHGKLVFIAPHEAFFTYLRVAMFAAFFGSFPLLLAEIWGFVVPGLYAHERKWFTPLLFIGALLFYLGAAFAYFGVFPFAFRFFFGFATEGIAALPSLKESLSLMMRLLIAFGIAFEVPLALFVLVRFGVVSAEALARQRGYVVLALFVLAAVLTPPDVVTQFMLALPMWLLFELSLLAARIGRRNG